MARTLTILALWTFIAAMPALYAGDGQGGGQRIEFHLSTEFPYIFRPASYLQSQEPVQMRYGEPDRVRASKRTGTACGGQWSKDEAKSTPEPAKAAASPEVSPSPAPKAPQAEASATPAFPVPADGPAQIPKGNANFNQTPDEVVGYFRNPYNFVPNSHRFFDPIFDPAQPRHGDTTVVVQPLQDQGQPTQAQQGPQSSATYNVTP